MGCECAKLKDEEEVTRKEPVEQVKEPEREHEQKFKEVMPSINSLEGTETVPVKQSAVEVERNVEDKNLKYANYPQKMLELINKIRGDPIAYADTIEESINNIIEDENPTGGNPKIIYKKKVKVALNKGEPAFREAAEILRNMNPLPPLELKNNICVPLPESEEEMKDSSYLKEQVKILRENDKIDVFFKDLIKIPEVSALLMIVDDSERNPGKKRQAVLSKDFKYIGINSKFIGKNFIAYFTFSSD